MKALSRLLKYLTAHLLWAGLDKAAFMNIVPNITELNVRLLFFLSMLGASGLLLLSIASFFLPVLTLEVGSYAVEALCCIALAFLVRIIGKTRHRAALALVYAFISMMFALGIYLGTFVAPDQMTVTFIVLLFALPQLFIDRPWRMALAIVCAVAAYVWAAGETQAQPIYSWNILNVLAFGTLGTLINLYLMGMKCRELASRAEIRRLSTTDDLTGMPNRMSYQEKLAALREGGTQGAVYVLDVNGLKEVNDTYGHGAGDEYIRRAASCILEVFGPYGTCYRMGGDEFAAILQGEFPADETLRKRLGDACLKASMDSFRPLHIAAGGVRFEMDADIDACLLAADKAMYADKSRFYETAGRDRRRRPPVDPPCR